jgi:hypothetical protein
MHLALKEHKALRQTHVAHGPKLISARHHDHADLQPASLRTAHHPE